MSDIYFNLHKNIWSVRTSGKVKHHVEVVVFSEGCTFVVQPAGRAKVIKENRKNVHAFVRGNVTFISDDVEKWLKMVERNATENVMYNPYKAGHFFKVDTEERIDAADDVVMIVIDKKPHVYVVHHLENFVE